MLALSLLRLETGKTKNFWLVLVTKDTLGLDPGRDHMCPAVCPRLTRLWNTGEWPHNHGLLWTVQALLHYKSGRRALELGWMESLALKEFICLCLCVHPLDSVRAPIRLCVYLLLICMCTCPPDSVFVYIRLCMHLLDSPCVPIKLCVHTYKTLCSPIRFSVHTKSTTGKDGHTFSSKGPSDCD